MNIVVLPEWLKRTMAFHHVPLTESCNLEKLVSILSPEDVAFYVNLNGYHQSIVVPGLSRDAFNMWCIDAIENIYKCEVLTSIKSPLNTLMLRSQLSAVTLTDGNEILTKLLSTDECTSYYLECQQVSEDTIVISPIKCDPSESFQLPMVRHSFYDRLIGLLSLTTKLEDLSQFEVFKMYLSSVVVK